MSIESRYYNVVTKEQTPAWAHVLFEILEAQDLNGEEKKLAVVKYKYDNEYTIINKEDGYTLVCERADTEHYGLRVNNDLGDDGNLSEQKPEVVYGEECFKAGNVFLDIPEHIKLKIKEYR